MGKGETSLTEFWKNVNMKQAIGNIYETLQEVMASSVGTCRKIFCLNPSMSFVALKAQLMKLKKLMPLERILDLKMLIPPVSENVWILISGHLLAWI